MKNTLSVISTYFSCVKRVRSDLKEICKGQKTRFELLQLSHRLEKGLLINNPKPLWGWEKAYRIANLLKINNDFFSTSTASAVLSAYLIAKTKSQYDEDRNKVDSFFKDTLFQMIDFNGVGGVCKVIKKEFSKEERRVISELFNTRHSCRVFSTRDIPGDMIKEAVKLALRCPSACNRQPFMVYVIDPTELKARLGRNIQYEGNKTLIITGDIRAFTIGEMLDWVISPTIFAAYLSLSLHSLGIGSCVVRKDLVKSSVYNDIIRELTGMEESEHIILEMFIGYYIDEFLAPVSNRVSVNDIVKFV